MEYIRTRSRPTFTSSKSFKFGGVSTKTQVFQIVIQGPLEGKPSNAPPDTAYVAYKVGIDPLSASGVTTFQGSGSRIFYDATAIFSRTKEHEQAILENYSSEIATSVNNLLSGTTPLYILKGGSETMTDHVTPRYKVISAEGGIVNSPLSQIKHASTASIAESKGGLELSVTWSDLGRLTVTGGYRARHRLTVFVEPGAWDFFGVSEDALTAFRSTWDVSFLEPESAINDAFNRVYEAEADLVLFAAEANKTAAHLALTASRIAKIVRDIKTGRFLRWAPEAFRRFKGAPGATLASTSNIFLDAWLEARYAWRPLFLDAIAALKYLNGPALRPRRTFRGFLGGEVSESVSFSTTISGRSYTFNGVLSTTKSVRAGVLSSINPGVVLGHDLGTSNPAGLVWELIPYSFVVDWFVNVGGFLAQANPKSGIDILSSWATLMTEVQFSGTVTCRNLSTSIEKTVDFSAVSLYRERRVNVCPTFINLDINLDVFKLIDSVALLRRFKH